MGALLDRPLGTVKVAAGTAGTPGGAVTSIQGVANGTPVPVSVAPGSAINDGTKTVTTAGTRVQLSSSSVPVSNWIQITAKPGNTGHIYVGSVAVSSTVYMYDLSPGDTCKVPVNNMNIPYLDSSVNGEGVSYGAV